MAPRSSAISVQEAMTRSKQRMYFSLRTNKLAETEWVQSTEIFNSASTSKSLLTGIAVCDAVLK
jgi:hypothetical protein